MTKHKHYFGVSLRIMNTINKTTSAPTFHPLAETTSKLNFDVDDHIKFLRHCKPHAEVERLMQSYPLVAEQTSREKNPSTTAATALQLA